MGQADDDQRRSAERLLAAFSAGLMMRLRDSDVWAQSRSTSTRKGSAPFPAAPKRSTASSTGPAPRPTQAPVSVPVPSTPTGPSVSPAVGGGNATILWSAIAAAGGGR